MTIQGLYVPVDGESRVVTFGDTDNLRALQDMVGGSIEGIRVGGAYAYGNDEAKLVEGWMSDINYRANKLALTLGWPGVDLESGEVYDVLVGPIVFFGSGDRHGNDTSVTKATLTAAERLGILPLS